MAAAASSSSSSSRSYSSRSYASSSLGPPAYAQHLSAPGDSSWTPNSVVSALTDELVTPQTQPRSLDLGPPGYEATIILWENQPEEKTVYLGPWEITDTDPRRVVWPCSYQQERFEHFLPSANPVDTHPHTLHALHRQFSDPCQLEQFVNFRERHRARYTNEEGFVIFDQVCEIKYEFTTVESSLRFQGDIRKKDLVDCYDVDVVWSDVQGRTDAFGNVKGIGAVQRLKLWADRNNSSHSFTIFANRSDKRYREYQVDFFEGEVRGRDEKRRICRLNVQGRRGSAPDTRRTLSFSTPFRPRQRSVGGRSTHSSSSSSSHGSPLDIRYLAIQFTRHDDYRRFLDTWVQVHSADSEFHGIAYPQDAFELPSPQMHPGSSHELEAPGPYEPGLPPVSEPEGDDEATP